MAGVGDQLEIKFRLNDGSDIGPKTFPAATSIATLKESVLAQWPRGVLNLNIFLCLILFEFLCFTDFVTLFVIEVLSLNIISMLASVNLKNKHDTRKAQI